METEILAAKGDDCDTDAVSRLPAAYRTAMGWTDATSNKIVRSAFERAHEIRQFEIELYWKRANYFWILQAAVFAAFGFSISKADRMGGVLDLLTASVAAMGMFCALAGWLSAKGSKFWQSNWEKHIDILEDSFEGKLHKTVWIGKSGIGHSVSRLDSNLMMTFMWFWLGFMALFVVIGFSSRKAGCCTILRNEIDLIATSLALLPWLTLAFAAHLLSRWTKFQVEDGVATTEKIAFWSRVASVFGSFGDWRILPLAWKREAWLARSDVTGT